MLPWSATGHRGAPSASAACSPGTGAAINGPIFPHTAVDVCQPGDSSSSRGSGTSRCLPQVLGFQLTGSLLAALRAQGGISDIA